MSETGKRFKIVRLAAENFKRLQAVEITPDGNVIKITGRNGEGKSSVIDAIWAALCGPTALKSMETQKPVREGEDKAVITVDLDDFRVTRIFYDSGKNSLKVESKNGGVISSPQTLLDSLIGRLSFDPLAFTRMDAAKQKEVLLGLVDFGDFDPVEHDQRREGEYQKRSEVNAEIKALKAVLEKLPPVPAETPDTPVTLADLEDEMRTAETQNTENRKKRERLNALRTIADETTLKIKALRQELAEAVAELDRINTEGKELKAQVERLQDVDMTEITARISGAAELNSLIARKQQRTEMAAQLETLQNRAQGHDLTIKGMDEKKAAVISAARFPVDGLGFDETGITFNRIPFGQCSSAEQIRISIAMAAALNPAIRTIRIQDGSLLDDRSMAEIYRLAEEYDLQVFVEVVDGSGSVGVYIEDGTVSAVDGVAVNV